MAITTAFHDLTSYFLYLLLTATLGPLLFGYHLAELNAPQDVITCASRALQQPPFSSSLLSRKQQQDAATLPQCISMTPLQFGLVSSFFTLGGLLGALFAGPLTARAGRLRAMQYTGLFGAVGPVVEALAPSIAIMTLGRFASGFAAGAATVIVPIFISEIAPPGQKGFFGSATQVMINAGILIAQLLGLYLSRGQLWRIILAVAGAIAVVQIVLLVLAGQESPKWLADNGKPAQAKRVLQKLRGHRANIEAEVAGWGVGDERDMDDEEETLLASADRQNEPSGDGTLDENNPDNGGQVERSAAARNASTKSIKREAIGAFAVLRHPDSRRAVFAVAIIMLAQQLCGINSIVMYGVGLLSDLLSSNAAVLNVVVAALNILVTIACAPLVDLLGRKLCLLLSMAGMGASSLLLALGIMRAIPLLSAVAVLTFVASFGLGLGPVPFILSSELVDSEAVGATQSWALAANWIATFVVAQFFPIVNQSLGKGQVYFIFAAFAALFAGFTVWWVPETKGKRDADEVWGRSGKIADRQD